MENIGTSKEGFLCTPPQVSKGDEEKTMNTSMMTVQEVAALLRISRFSVYNLVKRGDLSAMKVLNKLRFNLQSVEQYLNKQRINAL
ncbi:MAG: helix-turn-helix domain-containing protein [Deltaproteobacteria bacterium]|nr:helix-turn-helix domain-containing protein [Deltaproteobacteria bacterium]